MQNATFRFEARRVSLSIGDNEFLRLLGDASVRTRYQPIVRMADGAPVGLEVLVRLEHPIRGTLLPDLFLPQIEQAGCSALLTLAVMRQAFDDWGGGRLEDLDLTLALNFPLDVLVGPAASEWIEVRRQAAGIRADRLVVELTESRRVENLAELGASVSGLRSKGYGVAIDDVGPGARDHSDLLDLPFTIIKLDKSLVEGSRDSGSARDYLSRTIAEAHAASLTIVAEGVADEETWLRMQTLGVDQAQGFLVAHPLAAEDVAPWHRDWCARQAN